MRATGTWREAFGDKKSRNTSLLEAETSWVWVCFGCAIRKHGKNKNKTAIFERFALSLICRMPLFCLCFNCLNNVNVLFFFFIARQGQYGITFNEPNQTFFLFSRYKYFCGIVCPIKGDKYGATQYNILISIGLEYGILPLGHLKLIRGIGGSISLPVVMGMCK